MFFNFCNVSFQIDDFSFINESKYDDFHLAECSDPDYVIHLNNGKKLQNKNIRKYVINQSLDIFISDSDEYRLYSRIPGHIGMLLCSDEDGIRSLTLMEGAKESLPYEIELTAVLGFEKMLYEKNKFVLHSSFIETKQGAILFTAPSGTGKSTQADLWATHRGAEVINGDRSCIWNEDGVWMAGGLPWCGSSGIMKNKIIPLCAIVIISQAPENTIAPISLITKVRCLIEQITINPWNKDMYQKAQDMVLDLCADIPVIKLECTPDERAVIALEKELIRLKNGKE